MRRLCPDPGPVDPLELIPESLAAAAAARPGKPFVVANFVSSADGRASLDGRSTGLSDEGDRRIFRALRGCAGAVLAGTGTIGAEHYGTLARDPAVVALRARLGLAPQPPLVTITRSGRVPAIPLLDDPGSTLIVYAGADVDLEDVAATVHVERHDPAVLTMRQVLDHLAGAYGIELLLCEGGPRIFGALVAEGVCDELFLTLSGLIAGGGGPSITRQVELPAPVELELLSVLQEARSLYLRYGLNG